MRYELWIALRYLKARRRQAALSLISVIAIGGVALGVMALVTVLAVMNGLEEDLRGKILSSSAHIVVDTAAGSPIAGYGALMAKAESVAGVEAVCPFVLVKAMVRSGDHTDGVVLRGVDPGRAAAVLEIDEQMLQGSFAGLAGLAEDDLAEDPAVPGIVLGEILASSLRVFVGERVQLLIPGAVSTPAGRAPRVRTFQVVGIFRSGVYEHDSSWAYTGLDGAQGLLRLGDRASGLELKVGDVLRAEAVAGRVRAALAGEGLRIRDWRELNAAFFSALQLEKWAMFIILCLIVIVAAFNIVSTLMMKVMEKTKDIGVLKAIGATDVSILSLFLYEGLAIGVAGTLVGLAVGIPLCHFADTYRWITVGADVYNMAYLPFRMAPGDVLAICAASLLISLVTTLYPSMQAARLDPVAAMRDD